MSVNGASVDFVLDFTMASNHNLARFIGGEPARRNLRVVQATFTLLAHLSFHDSEVRNGEKPVKTKTKSVVLCMAIYAFAVTAATQTTWKLSKNLLETNNQISFNQGANKVWYFLQSKSFVHDPRTYQFLSAFYEPCVSDAASNWVDGMPCWQNPEVDVRGYRLPLVGINSTFATQNVKNFPFPPRSVFVHPSISGLAIIGWKSPFTGLVNVSGFFSDLDPTGFNGVIWSVDLGSQTLATGTIANGGPAQTFNLTKVPVKASQVLYFIVDPDGDYTSDSTGVDVSITKVRHSESE